MMKREGLCCLTMWRRMLLLVSAYPWFFDPFSATIVVNLENLKWRANIYSMSVKFHLHEVVYRNKWFRIPIKLGSVSGWHKHSDTTIAGAIARTGVAFVGDASTARNHKLNGRKFQDVVFIAVDR